MAGRSLSKLERLCFIEWLGIPDEECPPSFYRLIALAPFESDRKRIDQAARATLRQIQNHRVGEYVKAADVLAHQIEQIRKTLLDPASKEKYDASLREKLGVAEPAAPVGDGKENLHPAAPAQIPPPMPHPAFERDEVDDPADFDPVDVFPQDDFDPLVTARPSRVWYWIAGALAVNSLALIALVVVLLMRSPGNGGVAFDDSSGREHDSTNPSSTTPDNSSSDSAEEPKPGDDDQSDAAAKGAVAAGDNPTDATSGAANDETSPDGDSEQETAGSTEATDGTTTTAAEMLPGEPAEALKDLAGTIQLPERTVGISGKPEYAVVGTLAKWVLKELEITLDSSLCNLSESRAFKLFPSTKGDQRYWSVLVSEPGSSQPSLDGSPPDERRLAYLTVTPQSQLVIQWGGLQFAEYEQLCNAILRFTYKDAEHQCRLRQPEAQEPARLDLSDNTITRRFPIRACPVPSSIYCEIASLDNFRPAPTIEPANKRLALGEKGNITLGSGPAILELDIQFASLEHDSDDEEALQLRIDARYRTEEKTRTVPFKANTVRSAFARATRGISKNVRDLSAAIARNQAATVELARVQNTKARDLAHQTELNNRLQLALKEQTSSASTIRKNVDRLPEQYEALERIHQVALIGQTLHQYGRIQLRIMAQTENGPILLMSCEAEPPKLEGPIVLEGFEQLSKSAAGSWLQASRQGALAYDLATGGACQVRDMFTGRAVAGQWEELDQRVKISAAGASQDCQMASPFQLRSSSGASLYRVF